MTENVKQNSEKVIGLWVSLLVSAIIPITLGLLLSNLFSDWRWSHYPFHSMVESIGSLSALTIATLIIIMLNNHQLARHYIMVAVALIGMGLLDGFHAVLHVGVSFVWLHSIATLTGGLLFAMVWLSEKRFTDKGQHLLIFVTVFLSLLMGTVSVSLPDILPTMVVDGHFSVLAKFINITGGIGFLIGTSYFIYDYLKANKEQVAENIKTEDMVFANHCLLFGIAGLLFETSVLWDAGWWWWHVLRLLAYLVVLIYFFILFNQRQQAFITTEEKLQLTLKEQVNESTNNRMLFDASPIGLALTDMNGVLVDVNQAYADILGRTIEECCTLSYWDVTPKKYEAEEQVQLESLKNNGCYGPYEKEYLHKDDHLIPVRLSGLIIERAGDSFIWSSVEDISDVKKAYLELQYNQLRFAAMFESLSDAVIVADTERRMTIVNAATKKLFGYEELDLLGNATSMLYAHTEDFNQTGKKRFSVDAKGDPLPYELEYRCKDGSVFCGETLGTKIVSKDGTVYGFVGIVRDISDRKQAEQLLRLSEQRLNEAQHLAKLGSWELDLESGELIWSDEIYQIFDIDIDKNKFNPSYDAFLNAIHPDDRDEVHQAYTNSLETRKPYEVIHRLKMSDGTIKHVRETCESFFDSDNKPVRSVGTIQDITELKQTEQALLDSDLWMKSIFNSLDEAVFVVNPDREIVNVNEAALRIFGYTAEELFNSPTALFHVDHQHFEEFGKRIQQSFSIGQTANFEFEAKRKNGEIFPTEHTVSLLRNSEGKHLGIVSVVRDISLRKQHEAELSRHRDHLEELVREGSQELYQREQQLKDAQRIAHLGNYEWDLSRNKLNWSDTIFDLIGLERGSVQPTPEFFLTLIYPDDVSRVSEAISHALALTYPLNEDNKISLPVLDYRVLHSDGSARWFRAEAVAKLDDDGRPVHIHGTLQDVSSHKLAEQEIIEAKEEAEHANAAKSDFLSRMSHELRTPMNAILGFGQLMELESDGLNERQRDHIKEILDAGNHLLNLINEVLDLTEIESGRLAISHDEVSIDEVVKQCISLMLPLAEARQLTLTDNISGKGYILKADATRLKQVMLNLLSNAVKYNSDKGTITLDSAVSDKQRLRISITDTGKGLTKEDMAKLFTSFERLDAKLNVEGTGIGLVITKNLVELMGGSIGIESTLGEGSTFWIELELVQLSDT